MKQILFKGMLCITAAAALGACTDGIGLGFDQDGATGTISLTTSVDCSLENSRSRAEYGEVTTNDLSLRLTSVDGSYTHSWDHVSDFDPNQLFPVGTYTLKAYYGDEATEGFGSPYFYGSTTFKVEENETTPVSLDASLANALLDIKYTENFISFMTDYSAEVHSAGGSYFDYGKEETRPIYTRAGKVEVNVNFTKPNGKSAKLLASEFDAEPRHFYHVTVDVTNDGSADATLVVLFDDGLEEESHDIDISDDVMNAPAPTVTLTGLEEGTEVIELVAGVAPDYNVGFDVIAYGGLKTLNLTTKSESLLAQGWPDEINLIGKDLSALTSLGFESKGLGKPDKMAVINFSEVIKHITYVDGGENITEFTLLARDSYGKTSEPLTLSIKTTPLSLTLDEGEYYLGENIITFTLSYNGNNPVEDVTVTYKNSRGTWSKLNADYVESETKGTYKATASITPTNNDITLRAVADGTPTVELVISPKPRVVVDTQGTVNAFGSFAFIPVTTGADESGFAEMAKTAKIYVSTDGEEYTEAAATTALIDNKYLKVEGLTPGVTNYIKIVNEGQKIEHAGATAIVTETPIALTNGDMESWSSVNREVAGGLLNLTKASVDIYSCAGWATLNDLTTSKLVYNTDYSALSSTLSDANGHEGKCALIRSVGFGCTGTTGNSSNATDFSQGELFLGTYSNSPIYGMEFTSRPTSLLFWYKYVPKNPNDKGYVEIKVLDANNNIISEQFADLEESSEFTERTLTLDYNLNSKKAKYLQITFRSTNAGNTYLNINDIPKITRRVLLTDTLSDYYVGSQLYVDDIVLNY